ncbi:MAG TPA: dehydrogenase [Pseudolabrys sp.]|nr:dehydrogenase [Pseudolabrys sp.]
MTKEGATKAAEALWYTARGNAEIRQEALLPPRPGEVRVRALFGALSRGTEALVLGGRVPASEFERMRAPFMAGNFPFPVKYGYATVGEIEEGPVELAGRKVFALHPHQTRFNISQDAVVPLPKTVPPQRAVLAANMETALNAMWDAAPSAADRIAVVGAGAVGAMVAFLCGCLPGAEVTLVDINAGRADVARQLGVGFAKPDDAKGDCDVVFHASGTAAGLNSAIALGGDEATVIELSWYGEGSVPAVLGGSFHSRRLRLISSQVGKVASSHRSRWTHARRLGAALNLLADPRLDALIAPAVRFADLPSRLPGLLDHNAGAIAQLISYD